MQATLVGGLLNIEKAKAIDPGTNIYATSYGGSGDTLNKDYVTGAPDDNSASIPSDASDRYVYGKTYTHSVVGTITKVEIAVKYKVDAAFTDDELNFKYKIGSTANPYGVSSYSVVPINTSFSTYYLDITGDKTWSWGDITDLYIYAINNAMNGTDGNNLLIDALWARVTYTNPSPTSTITYPLNNYHYNSLETITGTATDYSGSGINHVDIKIKRSDNYYFNGAGWDAAEHWFTANGTTSWWYSLDNSYLTSGEGYTITSQAMDNQGNSESCPTVTFYYDTETPTGTVLINDGADVTNGQGDYVANGQIANYPRVKLNFTYDDGNFTPTLEGDFKIATPVGQQIQMMISNNSDMSADSDGRNPSAGTWINYTGEKEPWYLPDGNGLKTVYVQFRDKAGNVSEIYSDTIFYSNYNSGSNRNIINPGGNFIPIGDDVEITLDANSPTTFFYSTYSQNPLSSGGINFLNQYYDFNVADNSAINFPVYIKIYYDEADLAAAGLTEDQIQGLYFYDFGSNSWKLYSNTGVDKDNNFVWAWVDHFTPMSIGGDVSAPEKPANLKAESGDSEVILTWDKKDDAVGYYIRYRKATSNDNDPYTTIYLESGDTVTTKITGLTNGVQYEFGVAAKDSSGNVSEYAVVVQTPNKKAGTTSKTSGGYWVGTAYAADGSSTTDTKKDEIKTDTNKDNGDVKSSEEEEGGINWTRFLVTLGIIILALGAGFGGYYGYQWWMGGQDDDEEDKKDKKNQKKTKRDNRW